MNKLEARISRLEAAQKRVEDRPLLMLIHYCSTETGEVIGVRVNDTLTERAPGESVDALVNRAGAGLSVVGYFFEERAKGSYVPPVRAVAEATKSPSPEEPKPETPRIVPRPAPKPEIIVLGSV